MPTEQDFLVWAASATNIYDEATYTALASRPTGAVSGVADSRAYNKAVRQATIIASMIGDFIVNNSGNPAIDDGTTATLLANFELALNSLALTSGRLISTAVSTAPGANNYTPSAGMSFVEFMIQSPGGPGAGCPINNSAQLSMGGNGGGGAFLWLRLSAAEVAANLSGGVLPITLGTPGAGASGGAGSNSTASTIGTGPFATVPFGVRGATVQIASSSVPAVNTSGGITALPTSSVGTILMARAGGQGGGQAFFNANQTFASGVGGGEGFFGRGASDFVTAGDPGNSATNSGGGGGGTWNLVSHAATTGGNPGGPVMITREYS